MPEVVALDTNVLACAHCPEMPFHAEALALALPLANGSQRWAIPWPCVRFPRLKVRNLLLA